MVLLRLLLVFSIGAAAATIPSIDSARGEKVFEAQGCSGCHVGGQGGVRSAPNLSATLDRDSTPASLAATMWNHAPAMWAAMRQKSMAAPPLTAQDAGDLFAFFYSSGYFDRRGDAARGKQTFVGKHCADCHGGSTPGPGGALPVAQWKSLQSSLSVAEAMWNHAGQMKEQFAQRKLRWQPLSAGEVTDILVYVRSLPAVRTQKRSFELADGADGASLFVSKGCAGCHKDGLSLESRLKAKTIYEIAVAMWNHVPQMQPGATQRFQPGEMGQLLNYLWGRQYFAGAGDARHGRSVFARKHCGTCHGVPASGAPDFSKMKGNVTAISMVAALWNHGPTMLDRMKQTNISWPRFEGQEMSDLIAFLNQ